MCAQSCMNIFLKRFQLISALRSSLSAPIFKIMHIMLLVSTGLHFVYFIHSSIKKKSRISIAWISLQLFAVIFSYIYIHIFYIACMSSESWRHEQWCMTTWCLWQLPFPWITHEFPWGVSLPSWPLYWRYLDMSKNNFKWIMVQFHLAASFSETLCVKFQLVKVKAQVQMYFREPLIRWDV